MTLEQLRVFVVVVEELHVTNAANLLGRSQSAVSASLSSLENRLGIKLLNRVGRRIEVTAAGALFFQEARLMLAKAADIEQAMAAHLENSAGSLAVSASQTIGNYWIPAIVAEFKKQHPRISVNLEISNTEKVVSDVESGAADIGFVEGPTKSATLEDYLFVGDDLKIVVSREYHDRHAEKIAADNLREIDWVMREAGSGTRAEFLKFLSLHGLSIDDLNVALVMPTNESVKLAVELGVGAAAIPGMVVEASLRRRELVELPHRVAQRYFHLLWHRERYKSSAAKAFAELVFQSTRK